MPTAVVNPNARSNWFQNFVDVPNDVKGWLQMPSSDTTHDVQLQLLTDMTCQWAQRRLGQPIAPTTFNRYFNGWAGWNGAYIELPYYPVLEIQNVTENWGASGPHVLSESTPTNQVDGWQCDYQKGQLIRVFPGLVQKPWFPGSRNIQIQWVAGWNPLPADFKVATLEMIAHWYRNVFQQSASRLGNAGVGNEYDPEVVASGLWQGTPLRITALLDAVVQIGIA